MTELTVTGVDPGLVHTGVVTLHFNTLHHTCIRSIAVVNGLDADEVKQAVQAESATGVKHHVFIEAYRPRSSFNTDQRMVAGVSEIHKAIPGSKVINNTGALKIVKRDLMIALNVWLFPATHHQDLRSAGRILLFGMLKDSALNAVLTSIVEGELSIGWRWQCT